MAEARKSPLVVLVSGGGPVGLTFSLNLAMMMGKHVKIIIYEGRWFVDENSKTRWQGEQQDKIRRDQVVILQDHVIQQLPMYIQEGLFQNIDERVWPTSRNIPIREVEDQLLDLIEPFVLSGQVELICEQLDEQSKHLVEGSFDALVGADGSNSFVRRYCNIQMISEGVDYACGVAYETPKDVPPSNEPLHQALNCILSASQTRYMVSCSSLTRRGYLYIRLIQGEYDMLRERLQKVQSRKERLNLLDPDKCPQSPVWSMIRQGLQFYKINQGFVHRIAPIEISVRHASVVVRELRSETDPAQVKTMLAFLVGDAAMNVHFWPGRGMNSGMKSAMALARNIVSSCTSKTSPHTIKIPTSLPFLDFLDYEAFMARLRAREQQGRSLRILINPIAWAVDEAHLHAHLDGFYEDSRKKLKNKLADTRKQFEEQSDWPHQTNPVTDTELEAVLKRIDYNAVAQLSLANAWPTREMSGIEVLVEHSFPVNEQPQFSLPKTTGKPTLLRTPSIAPRHRFLILWIDGDTINKTTNEAIDAIRASPEFADPSSTTAAQTSDQLHSTSINSLHKLEVVPTTTLALKWIRENRQTIQERDVRFKVIITWPLNEDKTMVDVIRDIRTQVSNARILFHTNNHESTRATLEFPNIVIADTTLELYEFVGINQDTQWSEGYILSHEEQTSDQTGTTSDTLLPYPLIDDPFPKRSFSQPPRPISSDLVSKPFLFWIDSEKNDSIAIENIRRDHPLLEIRFIPTLAEARTFLNTNLHDLKQPRKMLAICRGYYAAEKKNPIDVANLLDSVFNPTKIPLCVYTRNRKELLKRIPDIPEQVEVTDRRSKLLDFIRRHLCS